MNFVKRAISVLTLGLTLSCMATNGGAQTPELKGKFMKTSTGYLMVLRHGDNVLQSLEQLSRDQNIPAGSFVGIGFMSEATFGFYDFSRKQFDPKTYHNVEMANMIGSIAWKEGKPSIHAHGTVTGGNFEAAGGHLLGLTVGTGSCEITVTVYPERLERFTDPEIQANVLGLPQK
jgi:predicted DNA-binding protein with PD1-like motif